MVRAATGLCGPQTLFNLFTAVWWQDGSGDSLGSLERKNLSASAAVTASWRGSQCGRRWGSSVKRLARSHLCRHYITWGWSLPGGDSVLRVHPEDILASLFYVSAGVMSLFINPGRRGSKEGVRGWGHTSITQLTQSEAGPPDPQIPRPPDLFVNVCKHTSWESLPDWKVLLQTENSFSRKTCFVFRKSAS